MNATASRITRQIRKMSDVERQGIAERGMPRFSGSMGFAFGLCYNGYLREPPILVPTTRASIMRTVGFCALWWLSGGILIAADRVDYVRGVKPIFAARCYACHGALEQKNGLRLDTVDFMKKGGDN